MDISAVRLPMAGSGFTERPTTRSSVGFSGGGMWCPHYRSVVGIVAQADGEPGGGRAISLYQVEQWFPAST